MEKIVKSYADRQTDRDSETDKQTDTVMLTDMQIRPTDTHTHTAMQSRQTDRLLVRDREMGMQADTSSFLRYRQPRTTSASRAALLPSSTGW